MHRGQSVKEDACFSIFSYFTPFRLRFLTFRSSILLACFSKTDEIARVVQSRQKASFLSNFKIILMCTLRTYDGSGRGLGWMDGVCVS